MCFDIVVSPSESVTLQEKKKKTPEVDCFLERSCVGLWGCVQRGALSCVQSRNATQHPSLLSGCAANVKPRGSDTHCPSNPPSLRPLPDLTLQSSAALAYLMNRASRLGLLCSK